MNASVPATKNPAWGFWNTMGGYASVAWPQALQAVSDATREDTEVVRAFLDSRHGRHFADEVLNGLFIGQAIPEAIAAATRKWMGWKIGKATSREYGIPAELPYLIGFVVHAGIAEEALDA